MLSLLRCTYQSSCINCNVKFTFDYTITMSYLCSITYVYEKHVYVKLSFFVVEFLGAFIAAGLVFGIYYDAIKRFDGGVRQVET